MAFRYSASLKKQTLIPDIEGQSSITVLKGEGFFWGKAAKPGDILISDISEPHGIRATGSLRVLVTIAPPPYEGGHF